ncbi:MAG: alpha/beta fold hydrolase, partial [Candidatus Dormibacteraeota bacterium]|nr:alpha/beta fold hydrolase [Candidatus Dormibacteraeota bacterium]
MTAAADRDFVLPQGRLRGRVAGPDTGPLALLVPGQTANLISMERIAESLAGAGWRTVALDLRGRGYSDDTPPGTYGWQRHARDLVGVADELGAGRFAVVGWSMGAFVAQQVAAMVPGRVSRLALIDAAGVPAPEAIAPVRVAAERLREVYPSAEVYLERVRSIGTLTPWEEIWERYLRYELVEVDGGVCSRTSYDAVL